MTPIVQMYESEPGSPSRTPSVFISHTSPDKTRFVQPFARLLRERGIRVWLDEAEISPGDSLVERIFTSGIGSADAVVVVLSRFSADSRWMPVELDAAFARKVEEGIRILVVRLDDVPIPTALAGLYWVNVDPSVDWSAQFEQVHRALTDRRPGAPGPTAPTGSRRHLLRGIGAAPAAGTVQAPGIGPGASLRWMLTDPSRWIEAYDVVTATTDAAIWRLEQDRPVGDGHGELPGQVKRRLTRYDAITVPLDGALAQCGYFGDPGQPRLWNRPLQRVLRGAAQTAGRADGEVWERLAWYPPLRITYAVGVAAVAGGREGVLPSLLTQQVRTVRDVQPAWRALALHRVLDPDVARAMPGCAGSRDALSIHLRATLRPALAGILTDDEFAETFARYEYLRSLLELHLSNGRCTSLGEFAWSLHTSGSPLAELVASEVDALGPSWPLLQAGAFGGSAHAVRQAQAQLSDRLERRFD